MVRQPKQYIVTIGVTDATQDNARSYEKPSSGRDALEAAAKVPLSRREYVSEVKLSPTQSPVAVAVAGAATIQAGPVSPSLKELAGIADQGIEALDATIDAALDPDAALAPRPGDEAVQDEAFEHPPVGGIDQVDLKEFRAA
jgi:hypothetical protein